MDVLLGCVLLSDSLRSMINYYVLSYKFCACSGCWVNLDVMMLLDANLDNSASCPYSLTFTFSDV